MAWAPPRSMCMFCAPGRPVRMLRAPAAQARDLPATRAQCADRGPAGPDMHALGALLLALQLAAGAGSAEAGRFAGFGRMPAEPPSTAPALEYRASPSACLYPPMPSPAAKLGQHSARSPFTPTGIAEAARLLEEAWAARASGDYAQVFARATLQLPTPLPVHTQESWPHARRHWWRTTARRASATSRWPPERGWAALCCSTRHARGRAGGGARLSGWQT